VLTLAVVAGSTSGRSAPNNRPIAPLSIVDDCTIPTTHYRELWVEHDTFAGGREHYDTFQDTACRHVYDSLSKAATVHGVYFFAEI
jgi:hypothetical protein